MSGIAQRIKGQEVTVNVVKDGDLQNSLTDVLSFNMEVLLETKAQGFLGETSNRHDDIYNGVKFDLELQLHSGDWFDFQSSIVDRARRKTPDLQFNISVTLVYPNGEERTVSIADAKFGAQPLNISTRGDYVKVKLEGMADDYTQVAA
jgi:hypothetical protein